MRMRPTAGEERVKSTSDRSGSGDRCPRCSYPNLRIKRRPTLLTPVYIVMDFLIAALIGGGPVGTTDIKSELICERCGFSERLQDSY